ncbi:hypothetical protein BDV96DRAFT_199237 [Lophiotrema nucula]|uniref:Uncharacterized protein n=1 Tax=Lophiotrema nucula TaxID=690887 RepID=A0A6A5YUM6_9PLEO|nr:hypothetical protein BDV96DRAFT_199237 [Lophiotrema nucula]
MSQVPSQYVHRGLWTNLEQGPVMGRTITTTNATGNLVIAMLAILTTLGASQLWSLFTFAYHQLRADGRPADGLFRQQQALLRTLPAPGSLLVDWVKLWWAWRHLRFAFARSVVQIFLSLLFFALTIATGIFASYVVSSGTSIQVLVDSPLCGPNNLGLQDSSPDDIAKITRYYGKVGATARQYASDCYGNNTGSQSCSSFTQPKIPLEIDRVDCPFAGMCVNLTKPGLKIDSGLVDLNEWFGWNLEEKDRVQYRQTTTCAVLDLAGRTTVQNASDTRQAIVPSEEILYVHLGATFREGEENYTSKASLFMSNLTSRFFLQTNTAFVTPGNETSSSLIPLPEMTFSDADVALIHVYKNSVAYLIPNNDPLFAAHDATNMSQAIAGWTTYTAYFSDFPVGVFGCTTQYQYCHARASKSDFCTNSTGLPDIVNATAFPDASPIQLAALHLIREASANMMLDSAAETLQVDYQSEDPTGNSFIHDGVPDNQWEIEVTAWVEYIWAAMQIQLSDYAIGIEARQTGAGIYTVKNMTAGEKALCSKLKMRNPGAFVNISVFGLAFTIASALLATVLDLGLLRTLIFVKKLRHPRIDRWIQDGVFQLQRRAYEAAGEGQWRRLRKEVPTTVGTERLQELPLSLAFGGKGRRYMSSKGRVFTEETVDAGGTITSVSSTADVGGESAEEVARLGVGSFSHIRRTSTL